jgi:hypothetical protein
MGRLTFAPANGSQGLDTQMDKRLHYFQSLSSPLAQRDPPARQPLKAQTARHRLAEWVGFLERL